MSFKVGLAPMEGVTDFATRLWFRLVSGPRYMTTPFLRVTKDFPYKRIDKSFCPEIYNANTKPLGYTLVPQIMASDALDALTIIEPLLDNTAFVELNCGCPAPRVVGHGSGSGLLTTPDVFENFLTPLLKKFPDRIAVKMRLGLLADDEFIPLFNRISALPIARLTIHGRTRENRYRGKSRWWPMAHAASLAPFPVIGSGDIVDAESFLAAKKIAPTLDGLIVGRGALRNPWIFTEIDSGLPVTLDFETLKNAIYVYSCLQELLCLKPELLHRIVRESEIFTTSNGTSFELWASSRNYFQTLLETEMGKGYEISRGTLARLKMLFNYLRSCLPEPFFEPTLFRASTTTDFLNSIQQIAENCDIKTVTLNYQQKLDWVYAGEK